MIIPIVLMRKRRRKDILKLAQGHIGSHSSSCRLLSTRYLCARYQACAHLEYFIKSKTAVGANIMLCASKKEKH